MNRYSYILTEDFNIAILSWMMIIFTIFIIFDICYVIITWLSRCTLRLSENIPDDG
jgi:hypothetical protein